MVNQTIDSLAASLLNQFREQIGSAWDSYSGSDKVLAGSIAADAANLAVQAMAYASDPGMLQQLARDKAFLDAQAANLAAIGEQQAAAVFWGVVNQALTSALKIAGAAAIAAV